MNDDLAQLLSCLKLRKVAETLDDEITRAEKSGEPFQKLLARLLRSEWHYRQECSLAGRIKNAKLPE